jgi:hypothetical protein
MRPRFFFLFLFLFLAACAPAPAVVPTIPPPTPPPGLRIGVSESASRFAALIAPHFVDLLPGTAVQLVIANQESLWADLQSGLLDAIFVHEVPAGAENWFDPVAVDAVVVISHPQNPLALTTTAAQALFTGDVTDWSALGGPEAPVLLLTRETGSGVRQLFADRLLGVRPLSVNAQVVSGDGALQEMVAGEETAVGFTMMGNIDGPAAATLDGVPPRPQTVTPQLYPLSAPLYFIHATTDEPSGDLRILLGWLQSAAGQEVVGERYGRVR